MNLFGAPCKRIIGKYPRSKVNENVYFTYRYGTSGFRANSSILESVMVRMGLFGVLRSLCLSNKAVGIMITASHNDECDNGIKLIDPSGEMLDGSWESIATDIANQNENELCGYLQKIYDKNIKHENENESKNNKSNANPTVLIGRDTRPHSLKFCNLLIEAAKSVNCKVNVVSFGEITTPQLHWLVRKGNNTNIDDKLTPDLYIKEVLFSFKKLFDLCSVHNSDNNDKSFGGKLIVDCANGVGGIPFEIVSKKLSKLINMELVNLPFVNNASVNDNCGAEHVHKKKKLPVGLLDLSEKNKISLSEKGLRLASIDGDCDRLMYYFVNDKTNTLALLDGDKQICLLLSFLLKCVINALPNAISKALSIGVVQTAYANGSSTHYIENTLKTKPVFTATGVKHLHHEAKKYDIGIYFEANGHGTILISNKAVDTVNAIINNENDRKKVSKQEVNAMNMLLLIHQISNQAIGDALSDLLLIEMALFGLKWSIQDWNDIYNDRPSIMTKLKVKDRYIFKTTNAERTCVEPKGLQDKIDEIVKQFKDSRSFVRPSGTEDCVRVYSESNDQKDANQIDLLVRRAVYDLAGGVGDRP